MKTSNQDARLTRMMAELQEREKEALKVYRPMNDKQLRVHESTAMELIIRGGKRSGKSVSTVLEFVSRILGEPIRHTDGTPLKPKFPVSKPGEGKIYWVIGYDVNHIGQTIWRLLCQPGLIKICYDKGRWRPWNPEKDIGIKAVPSGPALPERFIEKIDWEAASAHHFRAIRLTNGAEIRAYPSSADHPKQGDPVAGIWIDEDIQSPEHLKEYQDRLTDSDGWFLWSVWPHVENNALVEVLDRADAAAGEEDPQIEAVQLVMTENQFITKKAKKHSLTRMGSEDEIERRDKGELMMESILMYDFVKDVHLIRRPKQNWEYDDRNWRDVLLKIWLDNGSFPNDWTRYIGIDPSHTRTACCFGVVPPPEYMGVNFGNMVIVENELVLKKAMAPIMAEEVRKIVRGRRYEAFIMDQAMGRKTNVGTDKTVFQVYAEAFLNKQIFSQQTKNWFVPGCVIPHQRYRAVRSLLAPRGDGSIGLLFVEEKTLFTQKEFGTYRKKRKLEYGTIQVYDDPANPQAHDCMAALEYMIAYLELEFAQGRGYVPVSDPQGTGGSAAYRASQRNLFGAKLSDEGEYVHLGAGEKVS